MFAGTFQLTTSRGGRRESSELHRCRVIFQLTTSRGGRLQSRHECCVRWIFQLTTSRGGRRCKATQTRTSREHFNSRPHEEVDLNDFLMALFSGIISTHDLTRRSTHSLQIYCIHHLHVNSRPHEEVDLVWEKNQPTGFLFQLTTSRGGRQQFLRKKFSF